MMWRELSDAMNELTLTLAAFDYLDRLRPLTDGTVQPQGIRLRHIVMEPTEP